LWHLALNTQLTFKQAYGQKSSGRRLFCHEIGLGDDLAHIISFCYGWRLVYFSWLDHCKPRKTSFCSRDFNYHIKCIFHSGILSVRKFNEIRNNKTKIKLPVPLGSHSSNWDIRSTATLFLTNMYTFLGWSMDVSDFWNS
jgi:hypothetical protein